jgi:hypothetical protein
MFTAQQYRSKAAEYNDLAKTANSPAELHEFQALERNFTVFADNEQWLDDNHRQTMHTKEEDGPAGEGTLAAQEEYVLRCLGAAVIMEWNTLPTRLQRELFDSAGSMGELLGTSTLRGQIARFLHKHAHHKARLPAAI